MFVSPANLSASNLVAANLSDSNLSAANLSASNLSFVAAIAVSTVVIKLAYSSMSVLNLSTLSLLFNFDTLINRSLIVFFSLFNLSTKVTKLGSLMDKLLNCFITASALEFNPSFELFNIASYASISA